MNMTTTDKNNISINLTQELMRLELPSNPEWRKKIYFQLVEAKRHSEKMSAPCCEDEEIAELHHWNIVAKPHGIQPSKEAEKLARQNDLSGPAPITWTIQDIQKAALLLAIPSVKTAFDDEEEMRRVYTLIYDVFRYKGVFMQTLNDIEFYQQHPQLQGNPAHVWLLLFDMYHRSFKKRDMEVIKQAQKLFSTCGLTEVEESVWRQRVKIAAAIARLRIKFSALHLWQLLPNHLRTNRSRSSKSDEDIVTCWINSNRIKHDREITTFLEKVLNLTAARDHDFLGPANYRWDGVCPKFLAFHASMRARVMQCSLVQHNKLIVQDRSFCLGPATFVKIINDLELCGSVIQSHVNSPRTTAYLATILLQNHKISNILAFSAGHRKLEYEEYLKDLGMKNVRIYEERFVDLPPDSNCLEQVIAVFATPPNTYSAITDPIDLVCSRGGDLSMLEVLTESEETADGRQRVANILEEQRKTLRFAMSRPQIQLVLYETHSELEMENDGMVQKAMMEINNLACLKHALAQGKLASVSALSSEIESTNYENVVDNGVDWEKDMASFRSKQSAMDSSYSADASNSRIFYDLSIPDSDIFNKSPLPSLTPESDFSLRLWQDGCYLALLQRKEVTKLDDQYMIKVAEERGLFGSTLINAKMKGAKKKTEKKTASPSAAKPRKKIRSAEIQRLMIPTETSLNHSSTCPSSRDYECPKVAVKNLKASMPQGRRWWAETSEYLGVLKHNYLYRKQRQQTQPTLNHSPILSTLTTISSHTEPKESIHLKPSTSSRRLYLTRYPKKSLKTQLPLAVTLVQFPGMTNT